MATARRMPETGSLMVNVFDGTRRPIPQKTELLVRVIDGNQRALPPVSTHSANVLFRDLPVFDNFGDNYTVIVSADGYTQAGFTPVKIARGVVQHIDLMLLPKDAGFNFADAQWNTLRTTHPDLSRLLSSGAADDGAARDRYTDLMERRAPALAALLNITTAMADVNLPPGNPLDYFKQLIWDKTMAQDRFFGYADRTLVDQVALAAQHGRFSPEVGTTFFHRGATRSWKQVQFGEANVQITFHEGESKPIENVDCVKVEADMDYFKDPGAHALLEVVPNAVAKLFADPDEVIPNAVSHALTDPMQVYVLRWIAGRHAGVPEFNPPYAIV